MEIVIDISKNKLKKLVELTDVEIDIDEPDGEDVSYAIDILINNC